MCKTLCLLTVLQVQIYLTSSASMVFSAAALVAWNMQGKPVTCGEERCRSICQRHQGEEVTELPLKKIVSDCVSEAGKMLMLFLLLEDCQDLGRPEFQPVWQLRKH